MPFTWCGCVLVAPKVGECTGEVFFEDEGSVENRRSRPVTAWDTVEGMDQEEAAGREGGRDDVFSW